MAGKLTACVAADTYYYLISMKLIRDIHAARGKSGRPVISFEFFPPKTDEGDRTLLEKTVPALSQLKPDFFSVTYGAGGSTQTKTLTIVDRIQREQNLPAMSHLTCVGATKAQIGKVLDEARALGIRNILALRGDPPHGTTEFKKTEGGFEFSRELVEFIREKGGFSIGSAGFPEGHIACKEGKYVDWERLKQKVDAGVDVVITQLFFENTNFFEFHEYATRQLGITVPICPGVLPIPSNGWMKRFIPLCGAYIPPSLAQRLDALGDNDEAVEALGVEYATKQCEELIKYGVPGIHFYTMNKVRPTRQIMKNLGLA